MIGTFCASCAATGYYCLYYFTVAVQSFLFIKSNERSEYSYISLADFFLVFSGSFKICSRSSILIFRGLTCDVLLSSVHFYC